MLSANELPDAFSPAFQDLETTAITTRNGQRLSPKEDRFITLYIKYADCTQAAREAGYSIRADVKNKDAQFAKKGEALLKKDYIRDEIASRMEDYRSAQIADSKEVLMYLTRVMRGEEKDQFGLDVSIADRTSAAKELNRRMKEPEDATDRGGGKEVHLVLRRE